MQSIPIGWRGHAYVGAPQRHYGWKEVGSLYAHLIFQNLNNMSSVRTLPSQQDWMTCTFDRIIYFPMQQSVV